MDDTKSTAHFMRRPTGKPRYKEQYGLTVICRNERDQASLFRRLQRSLKGREIKVVTT